MSSAPGQGQYEIHMQLPLDEPWRERMQLLDLLRHLQLQLRQRAANQMALVNQNISSHLDEKNFMNAVVAMPAPTLDSHAQQIINGNRELLHVSSVQMQRNIDMVAVLAIALLLFLVTAAHLLAMHCFKTYRLRCQEARRLQLADPEWASEEPVEAEGEQVAEEAEAEAPQDCPPPYSMNSRDAPPPYVETSKIIHLTGSRRKRMDDLLRLYAKELCNRSAESDKTTNCRLAFAQIVHESLRNSAAQETIDESEAEETSHENTDVECPQESASQVPRNHTPAADGPNEPTSSVAGDVDINDIPDVRTFCLSEMRRTGGNTRTHKDNPFAFHKWC